MKDKNVAGILAIFLGAFGIHRFYLGQTGWGVLYLVFFWISWFFAFIDGIMLFSMNDEQFDYKYNGGRSLRQHRDVRYQEYHQREQPVQVKKYTPPPVAVQSNRQTASATSNPYKQQGLEKYRDYDYFGAIEDFKKSLELAPRDVATHFNLACVYSLTEDASKAFQHLDHAVAAGFRDFQKIKEHQALAYLRIQSDFDKFEANGFRLADKHTAPAHLPNMLETQPNLLDQLKKLGELREKGLLTEQEFADQKRKLLG